MAPRSATRAEARFERKLDAVVRKAVADGVATLPALMERAPGVFPLTLAAIMRRHGLAMPTRFDAGPISSAAAAKDNGSLLPHPLDYDWRFSPAALDKLDAELHRLGAPPRPVFCLGCPSVARRRALTAPTAPLRLFDVNGPLHESGGQSWNVAERTSLTLPDGVAVLDPPWYGPHFREFLWTIHRACPVGTDVLLAGPPATTRPNCADEMRRLMAWAKRIGFEVVSHEAFALPYLMPLFEFNTLRAHGVADVAADWRRADLWQLRLLAKPPCRSPRPLAANGTWQERRTGAVRVRIRVDRSDRPGARLELHPLGRNGFLSSVSSREPARQQATVVTSGGRFFGCNRSRDLLKFWDEGLPVNQTGEQIKESVRGVTTAFREQLSALLARENAESNHYHEFVRQFEHR